MVRHSWSYLFAAVIVGAMCCGGLTGPDTLLDWLAFYVVTLGSLAASVHWHKP